SCYDCLRDYYNQKYHYLLNWRLALDLAGLANDENFELNFGQEYWQDFFNNELRKILNSKGMNLQNHDGFYYIKSNNQLTLIAHPFWNNYLIDSSIESRDAKPKLINDI